MRSVSQLLRSAARCASSQLGCSTPSVAAATADGTAAPISRALAALGLQHQQHAAFAAGRRRDEAEEEFEELETGQKGRLQHRPSHKQLFERVNRSLEELQEDEQVAERQQRIQELLRLQAGAPGVEGAGKFVDRCAAAGEGGGQRRYRGRPWPAATECSVECSSRVGKECQALLTGREQLDGSRTLAPVSCVIVANQKRLAPPPAP